MSIIYDTGYLLGRHLTKMARNRPLLASNLVQPIVLLVFFSQIFQKVLSFPGESGSYLAYLAPGVIVMTGIFVAPQSGMSMVNDLNTGFLQKMLSTSISRPAILVGRLLADVLMMLAQSLMVIVVALLMGVKIITGFSGVLLMLGTVAFFGLAWCGFFIAFGMATRKPETLSGVSGFVGFLLLFFSSAMFPRSIFPSWAQTVSDINPLSYIANVVRSLIQGGIVWSVFTYAYLITGVLAVLSFAATLYQFGKVIS